MINFVDLTDEEQAALNAYAETYSNERLALRPMFESLAVVKALHMAGWLDALGYPTEKACEALGIATAHERAVLAAHEQALAERARRELAEIRQTYAESLVDKSVVCGGNPGRVVSAEPMDGEPGVILQYESGETAHELAETVVGFGIGMPLVLAANIHPDFVRWHGLKPLRRRVGQSLLLGTMTGALVNPKTDVIEAVLGVRRIVEVRRLDPMSEVYFERADAPYAVEAHAYNGPPRLLEMTFSLPYKGEGVTLSRPVARAGISVGKPYFEIEADRLSLANWPTRAEVLNDMAAYAGAVKWNLDD